MKGPILETVIPAPPRASLPVTGSTTRFPVRRIYCVGRNYAEHAREMGVDPDRNPPFFFMKPADCLVADGGEVPYPPLTADLHHEVELVLALGKGGKDIAEEAALSHIWGYAAGIDLTRRDLQAQAKEKRHPWDVGKGFAHSAPCGAVSPADATGALTAGAITLTVNGETRQDGDLAQMIWNVPEIIAALSRLFELHPGDLIFTGTPAGVGAVVPGDRLEGRVAGLEPIRIDLVAGS